MIDTIFSSLGSSWFFWIILIVIIAFIVYSGIKKRKTEKKEKYKRENEVRNLIKKHLKEKDNLTNVAIDYKSVQIRAGKLYKNRDVYDVFIEVKDPRTQNIVAKKVYEIEGFAKPVSNKSKEFTVNWIINQEFQYQKHQKFLNQTSSSLLSIYFKSLFKRNCHKYIQEQKKIKNEIETARKKMNKELKKLKTEQVIFSPQPKKEEKKF